MVARYTLLKMNFEAKVTTTFNLLLQSELPCESVPTFTSCTSQLTSTKHILLLLFLAALAALYLITL